MTVTLYEALRAMDVVREGYVVLDHIGRSETGGAKHEENVVKRLMERVCRKAGLPESGWHRLRHSFGTHRNVRREPVAAYDVNGPQARGRDDAVRAPRGATPPRDPAARVESGRETDPDLRILAMLGERHSAWQPRVSNRAADLQSFQFGARHVVTAQFGKHKGTERTVDDYTLHVQCVWRVSGASGIIVASRDRYVPSGDPDQVPPGWRWDRPGANRCDERIAAWLQDASYVVESTITDASGGLRLNFADAFALEVFPDDSLDDEHWRLLRPSRDLPHFVVTGAGISD